MALLRRDSSGLSGYPEDLGGFGGREMIWGWNGDDLGMRRGVDDRGEVMGLIYHFESCGCWV